MKADHEFAVRPTRVEVDLATLVANFASVKTFVGNDLSYMAIVKADAYGHGACKCAERLEAARVDWFGVAIPEEGFELRKAGITKPILCLGSFWPGQIQLFADHALTATIFSVDAARSLSAIATDHATRVDIHVKIDTGMGRVGACYENAARFAKELAGLANIRVSGLMTHLASAEDHRQDEFTAKQIERFEEACEVFRAAGHDPQWIHVANSPGAIGHPRSRGNLVRLGGALYGLLDDILEPDAARPALTPVLSLRSEIADIKDIPSGETLGYGRTFQTQRDSRIALVPVGYADGLPRALSNTGHACVSATRVPIVGRISMDWTMLDVTDIRDAKVGDTVTMIGRDGDCEIKAADIAREVDTIAYEITCGIGPRVRRIYL